MKLDITFQQWLKANGFQLWYVQEPLYIRNSEDYTTEQLYIKYMKDTGNTVFDEGSWNDAIALAAKVVNCCEFLDNPTKDKIIERIKSHFLSNGEIVGKLTANPTA